MTWNLRGFLDSFLIFHIQSDASHVAWISVLSLDFGPVSLFTASSPLSGLVLIIWQFKSCPQSGVLSPVHAIFQWAWYLIVFPGSAFLPLSLPAPLSSSTTELLICLYIIWNPALPCLPVLFLFSGLSCWLEYPSLPPVAWPANSYPSLNTQLWV